LVSDVIVGNLGSVSLNYAGDERTLGQAVRELVLMDVMVCGVEPEQNELERVFLQVTKGVLQ
jgi:ABC-2 type transport system ATP-binding protein